MSTNTGVGASLHRVRPASVVAAALLIAALAVALLPRLSLAPYPRLDGPRLVVEAALPGAGRDEVMARFTAPVERRLLGLAAVDGVDSWTVDGVARLLVRGAAGAEAEPLRFAVTQRLAEVELRPAELQVELLPADERPLLAVAVLGGDAAARTAFARDVLVPELAHAGGSERIEVAGAAPLRVVVEPRQAALAARGLTTADLVVRLRRVGTTQAVGRVREGALPRQLVVGEEVTDLRALRDLRLPAPAGEAVLRDVATVSLRSLGDGDAFSLDGQPAVLVRLFAARDANAALAGWRLRRSVEALAARLPGGLALRVVEDAGAAALRALVRAALSALAAGIAAGAYLAWRRRRWPRVATAIAVPPLALLAAVATAVLLDAALDPVALAVLAAMAGALAWPAFPRIESATSVADVAASDSARRGGANATVVVPILLVAAAWSPLVFLASRAALGGPALVSIAAVATAFGLGHALHSALATAERDTPEDEMSRSSPTSSRTALALLLPSLVLTIAVASWWRGAKSTAAGAEAEVRIALAPDLPAAYRIRSSERFAAAVVRALPVRPRQWSLWLPRPQRVDVGAPQEGVLRLTFSNRREVRVAGEAMRRWLAMRSEARGWADTVPTGWLAGLDIAARPSLWATAATAAEREALLKRATGELRRALPSIVVAPPPAPGSEWRVTARPRHAAGAWSDDVASGLGGVDAGAVRIAGVEPAIRVTPPEDVAGRLALLAVHAGRAGASSGVVPLAVAASVERVPRQAPLVRRDGVAAEERLLLGVDATQVVRHQRRLAALSGPASRVSLGGCADALARRAAELRAAMAIGALLVLVVLAGAARSLRDAARCFACVPVAWGAAWAGASLVAGGDAGPTVTLALLVVTPLAALASSPREAPNALASRGWGGLVAPTVAGALVAALGGDDPIGRTLAIAVGLGLLAALVAARLLIPRGLRESAERSPAGSAATQSAAPAVGPPELA